MDYLSERARRLKPYVAGLQPENGGWVKLNTNENPYSPSPKVIEALRDIDVLRLSLYPDGDCRELRAAIAKRLGVDAENVFAGNGSDEVLALAFQAFFSGAGNVLTPDISYGFYPVWCGMYDVDARVIPLLGDFTIDADDYKGANGVIIANPNAPTGLALSLSEIEAIVRGNPGGVVIVDEAYIDFADVASAVGLIDKYDNLLVVRTFSKSYSLAGLRVGFAVGDRELIGALRIMRDAFNSYPLDFPAQTLAKAAVSDEDYWDETRRKIILTREKTAAKLRELGYNVLDSEANFLFVESENAKETYKYLYENKILVRYWDKPEINRFLRVTVGSDAEMEAFMQCIEKQRKPK